MGLISRCLVTSSIILCFFPPACSFRAAPADITKGWRRPMFATPHVDNEGAAGNSPLAADSSSLTPADRKVLAAVATLGLFEMGYINAIKVGLVGDVVGRGGTAGLLCTGGSFACSEVLNGPWASVLGVPLTMPGMLSYAAVVAMAMAPLIVSHIAAARRLDCDGPDQCVSSGYRMAALETTTQRALLAVTTSMVVFSGYLMCLLAFKINATCPWCFFSAALSLLLGTYMWSKSLVAQPLAVSTPRGWSARGSGSNMQLAAGSTFATLLIAAAAYSVGSTEVAIAETQLYLASEAAEQSAEQRARNSVPPVTQASSARAVAVAKALRAKGAKMYGAYWCSHCLSQKQLLGKEAMQFVDYVECAKDGDSSRAVLCEANKVPGYPTWEVGGRLYPGEMDIAELEVMAAGS